MPFHCSFIDAPRNHHFHCFDISQTSPVGQWFLIHHRFVFKLPPRHGWALLVFLYIRWPCISECPYHAVAPAHFRGLGPRRCSGISSTLQKAKARNGKKSDNFSKKEGMRNTAFCSKLTLTYCYPLFTRRCPKSNFHKFRRSASASLLKLHCLHGYVLSYSNGFSWVNPIPLAFNIF